MGDGRHADLFTHRLHLGKLQPQAYCKNFCGRASDTQLFDDKCLYHAEIEIIYRHSPCRYAPERAFADVIGSWLLALALGSSAILKQSGADVQIVFLIGSYAAAICISVAAAVLMGRITSAVASR